MEEKREVVTWWGGGPEYEQKEKRARLKVAK
jgi:hypothetical protein